MGFFNNFFRPGNTWPYTTMEELNLDWIIKVCRELYENMPGKFEELLHEIESKFDKPINDGNLGDILINAGQGKSKWESLDESVSGVIIHTVNAWLAAHPEITTTVQDGAITPAKLDPELYKLYKSVGFAQFFFPDLSEGLYSGSSALMVTANKTVMFDVNTSNNLTPMMNYYQTLYNAGVFTNIDYIIISHYHWDHVQNLEAVLQAFPHVGCKMYMPINPSGYYIATQEPELITYYERLVAIANQYSVEYIVVNTEREITIDGIVSAKLLNSTPESYAYYSNTESVYNNYSMVALVKIGNCYSMFPGDIQRAAQERIFTNNDLPRLFLYAVHHHGIQNDDYLPYLEQIDPLYNVISSSYNRMTVSGIRGMMQKLTTGFVGSTGYDSYSFACNGCGGIITHGREVKPASYTTTTITYYVNNEYDGAVHDGTINHPFTSLNEVACFIRNIRNVAYVINIVKTDTPYENGFFRDIDSTLTLQGVNNPSIVSFYISNCKRITLKDMTINGGYAKQPSSGYNSSIVCQNSNLSVRGVTMDGENIEDNSNAICASNSFIRLSTVAISNYGTAALAFDIDRYELVCSNCTFNTITTCFNLKQCKLTIWDGNTFTDVTTVILGATDRPTPFVVNRDVAALIATKCTASAISEPFYLDGSHPVMIIVNKKIYNVLTGAEYIT